MNIGINALVQNKFRSTIHLLNQYLGTWTRKHVRHVSMWVRNTQDTLAREHISTQDTLSCEYLSMQGMLGTWARKACNLADSVNNKMFLVSDRVVR